MNLPPLPEPLIVYEDWSVGGVYVEGWTDDQMRQYATAAVLAEREQCAQILDANADASDGYIAKLLLQSNAGAIRARSDE